MRDPRLSLCNIFHTALAHSQDSTYQLLPLTGGSRGWKGAFSHIPGTWPASGTPGWAGLLTALPTGRNPGLESTLNRKPRRPPALARPPQCSRQVPGVGGGGRGPGRWSQALSRAVPRPPRQADCGVGQTGLRPVVEVSSPGGPCGGPGSPGTRRQGRPEDSHPPPTPGLHLPSSQCLHLSHFPCFPSLS